VENRGNPEKRWDVKLLNWSPEIANPQGLLSLVLKDGNDE
jgi:hypothetical protein